MLNREYPPCLGSLFKGDVESTVSNFFDGKQCLDQLSQERAQGSEHAFPFDYNREGHRATIASYLSHHKLHNNWVKNRHEAESRQTPEKPAASQVLKPQSQPTTMTLEVWPKIMRYCSQQLKLSTVISEPPLPPKERYARKAQI